MILQERGAGRRNTISHPVLGSGLGNIGHAGDPLVVKPGREQGRSGALARGAGR